MRKSFFALLVGFLLSQSDSALSQQIRFTPVPLPIRPDEAGFIRDFLQDRQGYLWMTTEARGLLKYDGRAFTHYVNTGKDTNLPASNYAESICQDSSGMIWIGYSGYGLDRFDPATNSFTHYRHRNNSKSLANDTVFFLLTDHAGRLWVGTWGGLDLFDQKTGEFSHFANNPADPGSLSNNIISVIYEDRQHEIWVGCGRHVPGEDDTTSGGLNRLNESTRKFIRFFHDPNNPNSLASDKVTAILEDSKGKFWIGTAGDGLHTMDRSTGVFTHYYYDPAHPEKLSRPPVVEGNPQILDQIRFIKEDRAGFIWIGSLFGGINRYDTTTKKITHYGYMLKRENNKDLPVKTDTAEGYNSYYPWKAISTTDGSFWIATAVDGKLFQVQPRGTIIPYYSIKQPLANTFYVEPHSNILWIGTNAGLIRFDRDHQTKKIWKRNTNDPNSISDSINALRPDSDGKLWISTNTGLSRLDLFSDTFINYSHNEKDSNSICKGWINNFIIAHDKNIWLPSNANGVDRFDRTKNIFIHYTHNDKDTNSISSNRTYVVAEDKDNRIWIATSNGLNLWTGDKRFKHYLPGEPLLAVFADANGVVWAGGGDGLFYYDKESNEFLPFTGPDPNSGLGIVLHIMEDNRKNLWVATEKSIVKINPSRDQTKVYGENYGVHANTFGFADNFNSADGELFFGDQGGYYDFYPDNIKDVYAPLHLTFNNLKIGKNEIRPGPSGPLTVPIWETKEIRLNYNQNIFSFDFDAIVFNTSGEIRYLFKLENYDNSWREAGVDHKAYFFNIPPGNYVFRVKAVTADGDTAEKSIRLIIAPPWWETWWAYAFYAICAIGGIYLIDRQRRKAVIAKERAKTRERELTQAREIEKAYTDLKATQSQLIQAEKMASLGELTAGIAHEIQNPLNFINNFAQINEEFIDEAEDAINKGKTDEAKLMLHNLRENEKKINQHGQRADSIVKGMLQHSRSSTGHKEPTNINALVDEYLRLSYHGWKAKDKNVNIRLLKSFDPSINPITVMPQDIGRVILNLSNNAFYAVSEKKRTQSVYYEPTVEVSTIQVDHKVEIRIKDNGNGISKSALGKIFQPFFTTKPSGQGTGLGLSIGYDIIKAHGGEIKVATQEGEGTEFTIQFPIAQEA
jgi:signal transduction histidine kinase/ligand-binding sensor domain-containing protein